MMNITDINFAIDMLSHPQSGDESDINMALNIAIESLKAMKEVVKQRSVLNKYKEGEEWLRSENNKTENGHTLALVPGAVIMPGDKFC